MTLPSVCLAASGMSGPNLRLQPWRYLAEIARGLAALGHPVTLLTDAPAAAEAFPGVRVLAVPSAFRRSGLGLPALRRAVEQASPSVLLANLGFATMLHQRFPASWANLPAVGILTSPYHTPRELASLGPRALLSGRHLGGLPLLTALTPRWFLRARLAAAPFGRLVVQTATLRRVLAENFRFPRTVELIPPAADETWFRAPDPASRERFGFSPADFVVAYLGSPHPLRGLTDLVAAACLARRSLPSLRLLILSRPDGRTDPRRLLEPCGGFATLVDETLSPAALAAALSAADLVALPFRLVPSDAPLALLEARALGKPVLTTTVACLPELAGPAAFLVPPASPPALAEAILSAARRGNAPSLLPYTRTWKEVGAEWSRLVLDLA